MGCSAGSSHPGPGGPGHSHSCLHAFLRCRQAPSRAAAVTRQGPAPSGQRAASRACPGLARSQHAACRLKSTAQTGAGQPSAPAQGPPRCSRSCLALPRTPPCRGVPQLRQSHLREGCCEGSHRCRGAGAGMPRALAFPSAGPPAPVPSWGPCPKGTLPHERGALPCCELARARRAGCRQPAPPPLLPLFNFPLQWGQAPNPPRSRGTGKLQVLSGFPDPCPRGVGVSDSG